ncbi:hypothetical protein L7F22_029593 [Adiantum nelumboides]|nr:hypothetical protein [Adiantum nelumboides]
MASSIRITFTVASHSAQPVTTPHDGEHQHMLFSLKEYTHEQCHRVLQSSLVAPLSFQPSDHGLVGALFQTYSHHHNLIICSDDIWLAILVQFGCYGDAYAEAFRSLFVAHQGKKELTISQTGSLGSADYAWFVLDMVS